MTTESWIMGDMIVQASQLGLIKGLYRRIKRSDNPGDTSWAWNSAYGTERTLTVGCCRTCFLFPARSWRSKKRHQQLLDISRIKLNFVTSATRGTGSLTQSLWEHWPTFCFCTTSGASQQNRFAWWTSEVCFETLTSLRKTCRVWSQRIWKNFIYPQAVWNSHKPHW